jgi:hypothetical protein
MSSGDRGWAAFAPSVMLVVAVALALVTPLYYVEWFSGHERWSYVLRTVEWASELRAGRLYPRWCPDFYGGYGSPLFLFYAPVPYAVAGSLAAAGLTPFTALKLDAVLGSLFAGLGAYALVWLETRQRPAALLGALLYLAAPYRIACLFERGDIGEFMSLGVLPVALALYRAAVLELRPFRARRILVVAAFVHAVLIMTHPILGLWGTGLIGLVVLASAVRLFTHGLRRRALLLCAAFAVTPALAGVYVVPAMIYRDVANTAAMIVGFYKPQHQWILLETLFARDVQGTAMPGSMYRIGSIVLVAGVITAIGLVRDSRQALRGLGWLLLGLTLIALTLKEMSWLWAPGIVPLSQFIQFPWRLLGLAALVTAVTLGIAVAAAWRRLSEAACIALAVTVAGAFFMLLSWSHVTLTPIGAADAATAPEIIRQQLLSGTDANEYLPAAAASAGPPKAARAELAQADGAIVHYERSDGSVHIISVQGERSDARLALALHAFPGWSLASRGPAEAALEDDGAGRLAIRLPAPGHYVLRLRYGKSWPLRAGTALSILSALAVLLCLARGSELFHKRWGIRRTRGS